MDSFIEQVTAICDEVGVSRGSDRKIKLSFDEWNVEIRVQDPAHDWELAPRLSEDVHSAEDAVVIGGLLISLLRHSDRVAVACFAQLVNVMALIRAESGVAWRQPSYHPFALTSRFAKGDVLRVEIESSEKISSTTLGSIDPVDAVVTRDPDDGSLTLFAINRSVSDDIALEVTVPAGLRVVEHLVVGGEDSGETNKAEYPDRVEPRESADHLTTASQLRATLPAATWSMIRLEAN